MAVKDDDEGNKIKNIIQQSSSEEDVKLREHQVEGVNFIVKCHRNSHGCILADEMGLGKTCQAIAALVHLKNQKTRIPDPRFLVVCPLSVIDHWKKEINKFGCGLKTICYRGSKEERPEIQKDIESKKKWDIILTTYELLLKDGEFFETISRRRPWTALIVDEAHRLKNKDSLLYEEIEMLNIDWCLLLTGTPVQNNLEELYSLLQIISSRKFPASKCQQFLDDYSDSNDKSKVGELQELLKEVMLRRTKDVVCSDIPKKSDLVLYHSITTLQKNLYRAILTKNYDIFDEETSSDGNRKQSLMNTLMQLRKCVNHPYLFAGVEPEPFEEGEHLIEASGKLVILDSLLCFLHKSGHKVLIFSQMTAFLDILQDYLSFRRYKYERLDGSVRGEERFGAVDRFNANTSTFVFLLSTRAGGLGLTLTGADTVIFADSDFNPQNDIQAAARAHRIGQTKPVKVIRLTARHTVEEIILSRAEHKLKLTDAVIGGDGSSKPEKMDSSEIAQLLSHGLRKLNEDEKEAEEKRRKGDDEAVIALLGKTRHGLWIIEEDGGKLDTQNSPPKSSEEGDDNAGNSIYVFEGKDYKEEAKQADREALQTIIQQGKEQTKGGGPQGGARMRIPIVKA